MKYNDEVIDFFKRHNLYDKEMFDYLESHSDGIDYYNPDVNFCTGLALALNSKSKKVMRFRIGVPYCVDDKTTMVAIHEISHGIWAYKHLNKRINETEIELFPFIVERVYVEEKRSKALKDYEKYIDGMIDESSEDKYRFALANREQLLESGIDYKSIERSSKKLVRKWKRSNR
jgi:hypothetical protein